MSDLQQHHDRLAYIGRDHWRQYESSSEHAERVAAAEEAAYRFFKLATVGQKAAYDSDMEVLRGLYAPRDNRAREAVVARWYETTADARKLFEISFEEILRDGELSEATAGLWDTLPTVVDLREVA